MRFRIDLKIFIFVFVFLITKQAYFYALFMLFALIHELGHLICGILLGFKPEKLEINPFGVAVSFNILPDLINKKIGKANILELKKMIVAIAGPLTNVIIIIISSKIKISLIDSLIIIYTNLIILIFNLIPIYPLDGGRIIYEFLCLLLGKNKALTCTCIISKIVFCIISFLFIYLFFKLKNISFLLINICLFFMVIKEDIKYRKRKKLLEKYKKIKDII